MPSWNGVGSGRAAFGLHIADTSLALGASFVGGADAARASARSQRTAESRELMSGGAGEQGSSPQAKRGE